MPDTQGLFYRFLIQFVAVTWKYNAHVIFNNGAFLFLGVVTIVLLQLVVGSRIVLHTLKLLVSPKQN